MSSDDFDFIRDSGNVFRDLGHPDAVASNCARFRRRVSSGCSTTASSPCAPRKN